MNQMKYIGIDYGRKRIGIALSDVNGRMAFPKKIIFNRSKESVLREIRQIVKAEKVSKVIVGLPTHLDGRETEESRRVRDFVEDIEKKLNLSVEFENEALTTRMARRAGIKKEHVDEAAAALILQSYLDKQQ